MRIKAEATFHMTKRELNEERERIKLSADTLEDIIKINSDFVKENNIQIFNVKFGSDIRYELIVPEGIEVSIDNTNGKTEISDISNDINVDLTNGNLKIENTTGNIKADIQNGKVKGNLDSVKSLNIRTVNGNVSLNLSDKFSGRFKMETVNGKISKKGFEFRDVYDEKKTFKGTLGTGDAEIKIESTNGKITLTKKL
ncbi:MAG: DUF4097 family beta strand repeat-containing protein [Ignavibacteria bacterium]|jgi:hypothetical protein